MTEGKNLLLNITSTFLGHTIALTPSNMQHGNMTELGTELEGMLKACKCSKFEHNFKGIKTREELFRLSLKDLIQRLSSNGKPGIVAARNIHEYLFNLQRKELDEVNDGMELEAQQLKVTGTNSRHKSHKKDKVNSQPAPKKLKIALIKEPTVAVTLSAGGRPQKGQSKYKSDPNIETLVQKTTGKEIYMCKFCGKKFTALNQAVIHVRIHTKERPYNCPHCEKTFSQTSSRNLHVRTKHPEKA